MYTCLTCIASRVCELFFLFLLFASTYYLLCAGQMLLAQVRQRELQTVFPPHVRWLGAFLFETPRLSRALAHSLEVSYLSDDVLLSLPHGVLSPIMGDSICFRGFWGWCCQGVIIILIGVRPHCHSNSLRPVRVITKLSKCICRVERFQAALS